MLALRPRALVRAVPQGAPPHRRGARGDDGAGRRGLEAEFGVAADQSGPGAYAASSAGTFAKDYERTHGAEVTMRETKQMLRMKTGFAMAQAGQRSSARFSGLMAKLKE